MKAGVHSRTPSVAVIDPRGLPVRQVEYLRTEADGPLQTLMSRQRFDVAARLIEQQDPRLSTPNETCVYTLSGQVLKVSNVDAGESLRLPGLAGQEVQRWDALGNHWQTRYDARLRAVAVAENAEADAETFTYAPGDADHQHNLRGQLIAFSEPSGNSAITGYGLLGQPIHESRTFHDGKTFTHRQTFNALGAGLEHTDAGGHRQQSCYDIAGHLQRVQLQLAGTAEWKAVLVDAQYNAAEQIIEQQTGNGVSSRWLYDPADGRLLRQTAQKEAAPALQDFEYEYDRTGNVTRILDHVFTPMFVAGQRIDGHRAFTYDSLSRIRSASGYADAPPSDTPGRPQPSDPGNRRNYLETYEYDHGNNLTRTTHVRDGANHTREMFIDLASNRGGRWTPGDPPPDFDRLYDRAGNLLALQAGLPMHWDSRGRLQAVTLIDRGGSNDDRESYRYSRGARVYKRHETHTRKASHVHEVRYLPNLQIRTRDNGEELHTLTLRTAVGEVCCLHWVAGKPADIEADQLRFTLSDHLGSAMTELDGQAQLISQERYFPFGGTAVLTARSQVEVSYKTVRFSGKEMDVSRLYDYGSRYYADWLQRWISTDPAGNVDGLNRYAYVGNNPMRYVDLEGTAKAEHVIYNYSNFINVLSGVAEETLGQIDNVIHQKNIKSGLAKNLLGESINAFATSGLGSILATRSGVDGSVVLSGAPYLDGLSAGNALANPAAAVVDATLSGALTRPLIPQTSKISVAAIDSALGLMDEGTMDWREAPGALFNPDILVGWGVGSVLGIIGNLLNMGSRVQEAEDIKNRLDPVKINKIDTLLADWKTAVEERWAQTEKAFNALGSDVIYPQDLLPNVNHMTPAELIAPVHRSALERKNRKTLDYIDRAQRGMAWYRKMGSTDNQFLANPPVPSPTHWFTRSAR